MAMIVIVAGAALGGGCPVDAESRLSGAAPDPQAWLVVAAGPDGRGW